MKVVVKYEFDSQEEAAAFLSEGKAVEKAPAKKKPAPKAEEDAAEEPPKAPAKKKPAKKKAAPKEIKYDRSSDEHKKKVAELFEELVPGWQEMDAESEIVQKLVAISLKLNGQPLFDDKMSVLAEAKGQIQEVLKPFLVEEKAEGKSGLSL